MQCKHRCQRCRLLLDGRRAREECGLLRRFAAPSMHRTARGFQQIEAIQLANAIVGEAGPAMDGVGARLELNEAQCQVKTQPVTAVAII